MYISCTTVIYSQIHRVGNNLIDLEAKLQMTSSEPRTQPMRVRNSHDFIELSLQVYEIGFQLNEFECNNRHGNLNMEN